MSALIRAAGGVLWRPGTSTNDVEVALVHRPRYGDWSFPKGKLSPGEAQLEGAVREVLEETGYRVVVGRPLGDVEYLKDSGGEMRPKVVHYWAMKADGGGFIANREVDTLLWTFPSEARGLLTHERDVELFERFMGLPADTTSVLIVRHASAGSRSKWDGDDRRRPLDEAGWEQAEELVRLLSRFGVSEIVSADFVRCEQTVQPLGESLGLVVQREPLFAERGYPGHEGEAEDLLRSYGKSGVNIAVCTQGDVVPDVVQRLAKEDDVELPEPVDAKKASVWALSFDNERLVAAEYFPPPQI